MAAIAGVLRLREGRDLLKDVLHQMLNPALEAPVVAMADVERAGFFLRIKQRIVGWFSK